MYGILFLYPLCRRHVYFTNPEIIKGLLRVHSTKQDQLQNTQDREGLAESSEGLAESSEGLAESSEGLAESSEGSS